MTWSRSGINRDRALAVLVAISFFICYAGVVLSLIRHWASDQVYAHGFLIPMISAYMLWDGRARLARTPIKPDVIGGSVLLAVGLGTLVLGSAGSLSSLQQLSLVVSVVGVVLLLLGRAMARAMWFPLLFLLFMIPVWEGVTAPLQEPFQRLTADMATWMLQAVGVPILHDGLFLKLPQVTLEVAEACSGVNFVIAILAVGIPQAYMVLRSVYLCVFVAGFGIVLALLTNALRVAVIGLLAYNGMSGDDIHGPMHILQGMSVAVIGLVVLSLTIHLLARWTRDKHPERARDTVALQSSTPNGSAFARKLAIGISAMFFAVAALEASHKPDSVQPSRPLSTFPSDLGPWHGGQDLAPPLSFAGLGADEELSRMYADPSRRSAQLYVGYFRSQEQARELVGEQLGKMHRGAAEIHFTLPDGTTRYANEVVRTINKREQYTLFWYDLNGQAATGRYQAKAWTIWQSLSRRRTNGAVVAFTADIPPGVPQATVAADTQILAALTATALRTYLPR